MVEFKSSDLNLSQLSNSPAKKELLSLLEHKSLRRVLKKCLPGEIMYLLEVNHGHESLDISAELTQVVKSWVEILFENLGYRNMFINFPRFDKNAPHIIRKVLQVMPNKEDGD
jgi:hypothetical protein